MKLAIEVPSGVEPLTGLTHSLSRIVRVEPGWLETAVDAKLSERRNRCRCKVK
jgi:hypothetical protein